MKLGRPKGAGTVSGAALWARVAATVRPLPGRVVPPTAPVPDAISAPAAARPVPQMARPPRPTPPTRLTRHAPQEIEPRRRRRMVVGRDIIEGRLDLHGLSEDRARAALTGFIERAHREGRRTLLIITGKGHSGDGVLRRRAPRWLAESPLRGIVAGAGEAHRRHGGAGALYVALKKQPRE